MQAAATADLDRIRREAAEVSERELRALRELRDAALDEAARLRSELRSLQSQHEELLLEHREGTARLDVKVTELLGELKLKGFELQRLQVGEGAQEGGEKGKLASAAPSKPSLPLAHCTALSTM